MAGGAGDLVRNGRVQRVVVDLDIAQIRIVFLQTIGQLHRAELHVVVQRFDVDAPAIQVIARSDGPMQVQRARLGDLRAQPEGPVDLQQFRRGPRDRPEGQREQYQQQSVAQSNQHGPGSCRARARLSPALQGEG